MYIFARQSGPMGPSHWIRRQFMKKRPFPHTDFSVSPSVTLLRRNKQRGWRFSLAASYFLVPRCSGVTVGEGIHSVYGEQKANLIYL